MKDLTSDMSKALIKMAGVMKQDYARWAMGADGKIRSEYAQEQLDGFMDTLEFSGGSKYIKVIRNDGQRMVWGFVVNTDTDKKFKRGDILMAAGWAAPARNKARGNVFSDLSWVRWTGPAYL